MQFHARHGDLVAAAGTLGFSVFLFVESFQMSARVNLYPRILGGILALASISLFVQAVRRRSVGERVFADIAWLPLIGTVAIWAGTIFLAPLIGFYPAIAIMLFALLWLLDRGRESYAERLARAAFFSAATTFVLWSVFHFLLGVVTPRGAML